MKTILTGAIFLSSLIVGLSQQSAHYGAPKFAPHDGEKLLIIGQDLGAIGGLKSYGDGYVDHISEHVPAGVTSYTSLPSLDGLKKLKNWGSGDVSAKIIIAEETYDQTVLALGLYLVNQLDHIVSGKYDGKIKKLGKWIKSSNRPVFLRIGYEFEGTWNHYDSTQFKAAWQHIVHLFDQQAVYNVAYVWQSAGTNHPDIMHWYPGDEYVNWVGYSHFDGSNMGQRMRDFALKHQKPIMIAEAAPRKDLKKIKGESIWNSWYQPLFSTIYGNHQIKALAYINVDWNRQSMWRGQGWGDSRVQVNDNVKQNWLKELRKTSWLTSSDTLFKQLNYQKWLQLPLNKK